MNSYSNLIIKLRNIKKEINLDNIIEGIKEIIQENKKKNKNKK
jgi:hypothetical protein